MNFQFIIPCSNADLLNSKGDNYYVQHLYNVREIPDKLKESKNFAVQGDPFYIFDHFDTYFSVIENSKNLSINNLIRSYDLLYITVDKVGSKLANFFKSNESNGEYDRNSYLNLTKMSMYLIIGNVKALDQLIHQAQTENPTMKKNNKKGFNVDGIETQDWDQKRFKFLVQLFNIMQLPLEKLWNPPVAEENFVNMICDVAYRTLENPAAKDRNVGSTVFQILGTAIKRYNHAITFPVRILQILRTSEVALVPTARGVNLLSEEFGITTVFSILIKDITETLSTDSADAQISKYFSMFLTELATIAPKMMIPHLSSMGEELLNCESHVLRNCVLQIMGDVITCELTAEDLSEELKEIRDEFLEDLLSHIDDVSAHVRSKVLQIWNHMKEENSIPLAFQHRVLKGAVERLDDKTATVRKSTVSLIKSFLERNPFSAKLTMPELVKRLDEENEKMDKLRDIMAAESKKVAELDNEWENVVPELLPIVEEVLSQESQHENDTEENCDEMVLRISSLLTEKKYREAVLLANKADNAAGNSEIRKTLKFDEQCLYYMTLLKSYLLISHGCKDQNEEFVTQENTIKFLEDCIEFSKTIMSAVPKIQDMLMSKTNSDVFEAVDFFTTAYLFGIKGTECGMRRMLFLVWSGDKEKRDAVSNAYKRVLFTTDLQGRPHAVKVVSNLCKFFEDLNYGHYSAMEVLIKEWVEIEDIESQIIQVMFERFTMKLEDTTENESRQALQLLIMASAAKSSIATSNINVIETIGFEERGFNDPRIYTACLSFLLNSVPKSLCSKYYKRYDETSPIVEKVSECFHKLFFHPDTKNFDNIAMRTVEYFYKLCQAPDVLCQQLLCNIFTKIKELIGKCQGIPAASQSQQSQDDNNQKSELPIFLLSRFIFVVGYVTMKEMIFLDIDVYNNLKFRQDLKEETKNLKKKNIKRKTVNMDMSASESLKRLSGTAAEPQQEPDEELMGASAEDNIAELINHICENELLYSSDSLLVKIIPVVIEICKNPGEYHDESLQQAASMALIRFMSVSSKFCENHLPFLMNILNMTKNIKIKCNIIVGLSDLTFRFPNAIEPWTGHFYSTLHERNDELRLTAVKMLSHLILHEMIRVKGQIADLAMCIVDPNDEIKNITQQFFKEIANKSNILYNVLPDIISKLSDVNVNVEEEKYHIIMHYILGLIQKDKQVESLVEKLCLRFRVTCQERQWRDIAFCLSLLNYTEKTIKKLIDNIQYFKDKVQVDEVYQSFRTIISNTSKLAKPELKAAVTEFESRLNECLEVKENDAIDSENRNSDQAPASSAINQKNKKPLKKQQRKNKKNKSSSDEASSDEAFARPSRQNQNEKSKVILRPSRGKTHSIIESESSEDEVPRPKKGRSRK